MNDKTILADDNSKAATPAETRAEMTRLSGRGYSQYRYVFVQLPDPAKPRPSTVGAMVSGRRHRELLLYMLLLTCWPWLHDNDKPLESEVWLRALEAKGGLTWSATTLSRVWGNLEKMGLITRKREDKLNRVTPRREDGAEDYSFPGGRDDWWNLYFTVPESFWKDEIFAMLSLPGLAMLLVIAKETSYQKEFWFTYEQMEKWYGIKPGSVKNGVAELERLGLVFRRVQPIKAKLSRTGLTTKTWYSLTGEFGHDARKAVQAKTKRELTNRMKREAVAFEEAPSAEPPKKKPKSR